MSKSKVNLKAGDKLRRIKGSDAILKIGEIYTILELGGTVVGGEPVDVKLKEYPSQYFFLSYFEPVFDLKSHPWKIRIENAEHSKLVEKWLVEQGMKPLHGDNRHDTMKFASNVNGNGDVESQGYWGWSGKYSSLSDLDNVPEIKLEFETKVKSVQYPEIVVKSEVQKSEAQTELEALEKKIKEMNDQVEKLKGAINND